jgi:hypothetical protein
VGNEFVAESEDFRKGFLVEPCSHFVQNRRGCELKEFRKHWQEKSTRTHEFVMNPKGGWCYMGRYRSSPPTTIEPDEFRELPKKVGACTLRRGTSWLTGYRPERRFTG